MRRQHFEIVPAQVRSAGVSRRGLYRLPTRSLDSKVSNTSKHRSF